MYVWKGTKFSRTRDSPIPLSGRLVGKCDNCLDVTAHEGQTTGDSARTVRIRPHRGWVALNLRELWSYRELLYFFVWRDLKVRYKQTVFGALWAVIQPFMLMVVFSLFLGRISGIAPAGRAVPALRVRRPRALDALLAEPRRILEQPRGGIEPHPEGVLPAAPPARRGDRVATCSTSSSRWPCSACSCSTSASCRHLFVLWVIPLTALAVMTALAVGIWLSAVNVRYRDVRYAVPFLVQLWLFASPVAYSADLVPEQWRTLYQLNPMAGVIEGSAGRSWGRARRRRWVPSWSRAS